MLRTLLELSKSGIVFLVILSVTGGFLAGFPLENDFDIWILLRTVIGVLFLASGSSALNQIQDVSLDRQMPRTAKRPLPSGKITPLFARVFVGVTLALGLGLLATVSVTVLVLGVLAVIFYNGLYTLWWKRKWAFAAVLGAIPGALPVLMGYAAATGRIDAPGVFLFALLFFWQMPHFWVLAIKYEGEYRLAGIPTLSVARGIEVTRQQILLWSLAYCGVSILGIFFLRSGFVYLGMAFLTSAILITHTIKFMRAPDNSHWLKFFLWVNFSLILYLAAAVADRWSIYALVHLR